MARMLIEFAQRLPAFQQPEIAALTAAVGPEAEAVLAAFPITEEAYIWEATWPSVDMAMQVARRAVLIHLLYKVLGRADTLEGLLDTFTAQGPPADLADFSAATTFRFVVAGHRRHLDWPSQQRVIDQLLDCPGLPFGTNGKVDLKTARRVFRVLVVYSDDTETAHVVCVYLLEEMCQGSREALERFKLTKRPYLGTTSMDTELAFLMASQAQARPGAIILDPFVGTGSILVPMTHFGAFTVGVELDPRVLRGTGRPVSGNQPGTNVLTNFQKFSLGHLADAMIADAAHAPFRAGPIFDAIVTDPPYGVREGARQLAPRSTATEGYEPSVRKVPYETVELLTDLVTFAAKQLVVGGRLVYWLATTRESFHVDDIPLHPALRLIVATPQHFSRWSRHLVTMEKTHEPLPSDRVRIPSVERNHVPSFAAFRDTYFAPAQPLRAVDGQKLSRKKRRRLRREGGAAAAVLADAADGDNDDDDNDDNDDDVPELADGDKQNV